jgi:hypothetical protein
MAPDGFQVATIINKQERVVAGFGFVVVRCIPNRVADDATHVKHRAAKRDEKHQRLGVLSQSGHAYR